MNANGQLIETLTRSGTYESCTRAYTETTGLPLTLRPVESWQLPFHGKPRENVFCALMAENSHTCSACLQLQAKLIHAARHKPATRMCAYGLCETAVPLKLGPRTIGFLQTGQVLRQPPTAASYQRAVQQARKRGVDIGGESAKRAYFQTPVVSQRKLDAAAGLLGIFAEHLALRSNHLALQAANAEPPLIARAREFIRDHYTEDISLCQVAGAVNTSLFYFCKLFRKHTTFTFTEYLSRTRIEKSKNLLLNPNLRISEIAFAVGFQSLTHFNRVFKKIVCQSPTGYRGNLPVAA